MGFSHTESAAGLGLTMEEEALVAFELGRTSPAFRSVIGSNNGIGSAAIVFDGTEEQKQNYLPKYATGEWVGSFCLTESDVGSGAASAKPLRSGMANTIFSTAQSASLPTRPEPTALPRWLAPTRKSRAPAVSPPLSLIPILLERKQFGKPIAEHQMIQSIGDLKITGIVG